MVKRPCILLNHKDYAMIISSTPLSHQFGWQTLEDRRSPCYDIAITCFLTVLLSEHMQPTHFENKILEGIESEKKTKTSLCL